MQGEGWVIVKGSIPKELKLRFKVVCIQKELEMSTILESLIEKWIQTGAPLPKNAIDFSNKDFEDVKGYIPKPLKIQFKVLCTQKQTQMRSVMYNLIHEWLQANV
jgi:hypothetical protein